MYQVHHQTCEAIREWSGGGPIWYSTVPSPKKLQKWRACVSIIGNLQAFVPACNQICFSFLNGPNFKDTKLQFFAHHFIYLAHLDRFIVQKLICEIVCPVYKCSSSSNFSCSGKDVFSMKAFTKNMSSYVISVKSTVSCLKNSLQFYQTGSAFFQSGRQI